MHKPNHTQSPDSSYDVLIVGARAAGAATAMLLARKGLRVLAVDRQGYGSDTLSTHALMRGAVSRLSEWGLLPALWAAGTPTITKMVFHYGDTVIPLPVKATPDIAGLAAPRRTVLDPILVDAARDAGAHVLHRTRVTALNRDDSGRVTGAALVLDDGRHCEVSANLVVGADGLRSGVARAVNAAVTRKGAHGSAYVVSYVTGTDLDTSAFTWLYRPGIGGGVIPTNSDTVCVFTAMPPARFRHEANGDLGAGHSRTLQELDPQIAQAIATGTQNGPIRSWPGVPGQFRKPHGPGWALVGDAGYFKDPFAAHGITDAFRDAELLTRAITYGDFDTYERTRDELSDGLFNQLELIASYGWDTNTLPPIHLQLSAEMQAEEAAFTAHGNTEPRTSAHAA